MKRLSLIITAILFAVCSFAQLSIWDGTDDVWTKGAGTESSPYLIESAQQLAFIASMVNGGVTTYENTYFKLMTNIDLNGRSWSSISGFNGNFDGNNHSIYNGSGALFSSCLNATIQRLNVKMSGFVLTLSNSLIKDCFFEGDKMVYSANNSTFHNCCCTVNVPNMLNVLCAGMVYHATQCTFYNCKMYGTIIAKYRYGETVYQNGKIIDQRQNIYVAGLVAKSTKCNYNQCSCDGQIESWGNTQYHYDFYGFAGGLVGLSVRDTFSYCCVKGDISTNVNTCYGGAGGITGITSNYDTLRCYIKNSFTTNSSLCYVATYPYYAGENVLIRTVQSNTGSPRVSNSYTSFSKTEEAMKSASFPIVLNTDSTVFITDITPNVNSGYPIYANQVYPVTDVLTSIDFTSVQLLGHFYALNADSVGFEYKEATDNTHWYKSVTAQTIGNVVTYDLSNLTTGTNYVYRLWVERDGVRYFGDVLSFKTLECSQNVTPISASICQGEEYFFNEQHLTKSGAYRDTLIAIDGCDSIVELALTVMPTANIDKYDTVLVGENYDFYGNILTETGDYEHYIPMANKCNLVILHLYVRQPSVVVTATSSDETLGRVEGGGTYEKYSQVTLTAIPNNGCKFVKWSDENTENPRIITPTEDCSYTAVFEQIQYTLTVTSADTQKGNVSGGGKFTYGQLASIVATPNEGYSFKEWSDGDTNASRTITIVSDSSLIASFEILKYIVTATSNDETLGTVYGGGEYAYNEQASLMAVPNTSCEFVTWNNGVNTNPYIFVVTANLTIQAIFRHAGEGIDDIEASTVPRKILRDGQIYILRGDRTYTVTGQEVK